jgi:hypothetical protein
LCILKSKSIRTNEKKKKPKKNPPNLVKLVEQLQNPVTVCTSPKQEQIFLSAFSFAKSMFKRFEFFREAVVDDNCYNVDHYYTLFCNAGLIIHELTSLCRIYSHYS